MKKFVSLFGIGIILFAFVVSMQNSYAASPRNVLVEELTTASCPPCATYNPAFHKYLHTSEVSGNVIPLIFHPSWPSPDVMYSDDPNMHTGRQVYYEPSGISVPATAIDGSYPPINPADLAAVRNLVAADSGKNCPYTITVTETKSGASVTITVTVQSDVAITNKKLRVAAVEYYHHYDNAGTNGEKDFSWICRKMFPDFNGQDISLAAGASKDFTFNYTIKSAWTTNQMYAVAFIQDDATKKVLQAGTSLKLIKAEATITSPFMKIDVNSQKATSVTINNPNSKSVIYDLAIDKTNFPAGWDATLEKSKVTVPAGGSTQIEVSVSIPDAAGFIAVPVNVTPESSTEIAITATAYAYALSSKTKYAAFYTASNESFYDFQPLIQHSTYGKLAAYIPFHELTLDAYPLAQTFDAAFFCFDINVFGILGGWDAQYGGLPHKLFNYLTAFISAGKKLYISSDMDMGVANDAFASSNITGSQEAKDFFSQTLGLNYKSSAVRYHTQNGYIYPDQFSANGIAADPISKDFVTSPLILNQYNSQTHPYYMQFSDIFTPNLTKGANPIFYYDNNIANVGGARITKGDAKIVYMSFGPSQITSSTAASNLSSKILDWLLAGGEVGAPEITLSLSGINFGEIVKGNYKDTAFVISNTGNKPLNISDIKFLWNDNPGTFTIMNKPSLPFALDAGLTKTLQVRFSPQAEGDFSENIEIDSDDPNTPSETVSLDGKGVKPSSVKDGIYSVGDFSMNVGPNPFSEKTIVNYSLTGDTPQELSMTVVDASGREVAKLVNGTITPGSYNLEFNGSSFAAGTYYIIANINGKSEQLPVVLVK